MRFFELFFVPLQPKRLRNCSRLACPRTAVLAPEISYKYVFIMVPVAFKNRTRDEIIAAFRESIRKKNEWIKESDEEFKKIREERRQLAL